jgi:signal transduction histidine kinase
MDHQNFSKYGAVDRLHSSVGEASEAIDQYAQRQPKEAEELRGHIAAMAKIVGGLSAKINSVDKLGTKNYMITEPKNPLLSAAFLAPAFLMTAVIIVSIWLFNLAGLLNANVVYVLTVIIAFLLVLQVLVSNIRNLQLRKKIAAQSGVAMHEELQLERARAEFFQTATDELQGHLFAITSAIPRGSDAAVDDATQRLLALLDRMSLISTLTNRGADYAVNTEPVDVSQVLSRAIRECKDKSMQANVAIRLEAPRSLVCKLDPLLLSQAVSPVLENAIKFSKDVKTGGRVLVRVKPSFHGFELRIADNGPGVAPERRSQLFKPFSRGEDALRFNYEGAGLGLYLSSLATGLLGASVEFGNPKVGTEVIWKFQSLPAATEAPPKLGTRQTEQKLAPSSHSA